MKNPISVIDGYEWGFKHHVRLSTLYKNGQFEEANDNREHRPFKNIIRPILNLQYYASGFDVKDIDIYVDEQKNYYKSFLIRKYHEQWAVEKEIDTFIDSVVESYVDFGGVLVKKTKDVCPEVVPLQSIAFCDQTDVLSGPIAIRHYYSSDQLMEQVDAGWSKENIEIVIGKIEYRKIADKQKNGRENKTPGGYVEVYEVHGMFPASWLSGSEKDKKFTRQLHIVTFYKDDNNEKQYLTLFKGKEKELPFKFLKRDPIFGRALGYGGAEELFEPQIWLNHDNIRREQMLAATSKILYKTTDPTLVAKHPTGLKNLKNSEVIDVAQGADIGLIDTFPRNAQLFDKSIADWEAHAQQTGSASDALLGQPPTAGTPFKLQELVVQTGRGVHEYRKGKIAIFIGEMYTDWIIPYLAKEVTKEREFLAELDLKEMQTVAVQVVENEVNNFVLEKVLNGDMFQESEIELLRQEARERFMKQGNKRFIKILEKEMSGYTLGVKVSIVNKQKNMPLWIDKLVNILRQVTAAPQMLQVPGMGDLFNNILEYAGLSPIDFAAITEAPQSLPQPQRQEQAQPVVQPSALPV